MKKIIFTVTIILLAVCLKAQNITGTWYGALDVRGKSLPVVFHISKTGDNYQTTMDIPDQMANGLPFDSTAMTGNKVHMVATKFGMSFTGTYMPDSNKINGLMSQGPNSSVLSLTTSKPEVTAAIPNPRPQDPVTYPYKREEVSFTNTKASVRLAGTLTMPENGKATKIVVMITGSGPQNRDEEVVQFNHRPFLVWSDWLTRNGIAVLRYDDRGIGASTGVFGTSTSEDFSGDVEAAISYIQSRDDLKNLSIGLIGHSEGGMIAPMVASHNSAVKFIVLLAGPGLPVSQLMMQQSKDQMRLSGAPDSAIAKSMELNKKMYATINASKNLSSTELAKKLDTIMRAELKQLPEAALGGQSEDEMVKTSIATLTSPWYRYFIAFDPAVYLSHTKCPVLAMNGTLDMQVGSDNLKAIKENLQKAGNKNVQIVPLDGLNHLFQKATTGSVAEYGQITETVNPIALKTVTEWINKL